MRVGPSAPIYLQPNDMSISSASNPAGCDIPGATREASFARAMPIITVQPCGASNIKLVDIVDKVDIVDEVDEITVCASRVLSVTVLSTIH